MKSQLRCAAVAILLLGGLLLVVELVRETYPGSHLTIAGYSLAVLVTVIVLVEARGLYVDRVSAWVFAVPLTALIAVGALTTPQHDQAQSALLAVAAVGLSLVTAARAFVAWSHRSNRA